MSRRHPPRVTVVAALTFAFCLGMSAPGFAAGGDHGKHAPSADARGHSDDGDDGGDTSSTHGHTRAPRHAVEVGSDDSSGGGGGRGGASDDNGGGSNGGGGDAPRSSGGSSDQSSEPSDISVGGGADVGAFCVGDTVTVTSSKDVSNAVLRYADGDVKFDGLSGRSVTLPVDTDRDLEGVFVKSGNNKSGAGPGYGEFIALDCAYDDDLDGNGDGDGGGDDGDNDGDGDGGDGAGDVGDNDGDSDDTSVDGVADGDGPSGPRVLGVTIAGPGSGFGVAGATVSRAPQGLAVTGGAPLPAEGIAWPGWLVMLIGIALATLSRRPRRVKA